MADRPTLAGSNLTPLKGGRTFSAGNFAGRNVHFGVREHAMGSMMNGMALHGGIIPYGGTFLIFADYMRPAIRLAALMKQRVIYVFTHDSIGLGEDGPTHQPVEQLTSLRCIPQHDGHSPRRRRRDGRSVAHRRSSTRVGPWRSCSRARSSRCIDRAKYAPVSGAQQGGYVLADDADGRPEVILLASGSEVDIALHAYTTLAADGIRARLVSMPSQELFLAQSAEYQASVLPAGVKRVAIEAAHPMSWQRFVGDGGAIIGIDTFGASAPFQILYEEYGITAEHMVAAVHRVLGR